MTWRVGVWSASLVASVIAGCSLSRGVIAPGSGVDAALTDIGAGQIDAGTDATHVTDAGHVDAGTLGNDVGTDVGSVDGGACTIDTDCPVATTDPWGACEFGTNVCATSGMQTRGVHGYRCLGGSCVPTTTTDTQACTRPSTDGTMCAAPTYGAWSACNFGSNGCATSGMQMRSVTTSTCHAGTCGTATSSESQACTQPSTDGMSCGTAGSTMGACMSSTPCSTSGMQMVTTTNPTCMGGTCHPNMMSSMQACTLGSTDGTACGMQTCSAWSACTQTNPMSCDTSGQQTRTCMTPTCSGGTCGSGTASTQTQACTFSVNGVACTTVNCGNCNTGIPFVCPSGQTGSRTCGTTMGHCAMGFSGFYCMGATSYMSMSCAC